MASFDITAAAGAGYQLVWNERSYLVRLAAIPFVMKLVCFMIVLILGWQENFIRQAIVMLPSYFADGWLFSHLVRLIFLGQRWPFRMSGNMDKDMPLLQDRAMGIMKGTLTFVVIRFLLAGVTTILYEFSQSGASMKEGDVSSGMFIVALASLIFFFWGFRLLWLHIPAAINYPIRKFMADMGGYFTSFHLIGLWLLCFVPLFFVFGMFLSVISTGVEGQTGSASMVFFVNFLRVILDMLVGILSTAGIAFGIKKYILPNHNKN